MSGRAAAAYERFFADCAVDGRQLRVFRLVFFALLGIDAFAQIVHAPRYGAGGFNASHFPGLDSLLPTPTPAAMVGLFLLQAFLAFRLALGRPQRAAMAGLAALYAYAYLISQLDSYQHHYFVLLLLFLFCFVPWADAEPRHWSLRLVLLQGSLMYFWAAIAKLDGRWLDGTALEALTSGSTVGGLVTATVGWALASKLVAGLELLLAFAIHWPRSRGLAAILGIVFHIGIEAAGFEIGLFSYYMVAFYLLVLPPEWWRRLFGPPPDRVAHAPTRAPRSSARVTALALSAGAVGLVAAIPLPSTALAAMIVAGLGLTALLRADSPLPAARAHLVSALLLWGLAEWGPTPLDYYRYTGGSSRRRGDYATAAAAYRHAIALRPKDARAHAALGRILRLEGRFDDALEELRTAQRLDPEDPVLFLREAWLHHQLGRGAQALAAAERALELDPELAEARQIAEHWRSRQ